MVVHRKILDAFKPISFDDLTDRTFHQETGSAEATLAVSVVEFKQLIER